MRRDHLSACGIRIAFGGIRALRGVDIDIAPGQVVGLIGRNGSGKSTLFNCIAGVLRPDEGTVRVGEINVTDLPTHRVVKHGIVRTFQTPRFDPEMTVLTAVMCGAFHEFRSSFLSALLGTSRVRREERELLAKAEHSLQHLGLGRLADKPLGNLSMGQLRLIDVARCLAAGARFIMLDEPAAGLTTEEQIALCDQVHEVSSHGIGVLLVEHNFGLIRRMCEKVTVLDEGHVVCVGTPSEVASNARVLSSYLGTSNRAGQGLEAVQ
jgi:ABC-type branched-subunit amino acid transport system ATPase component